MKPQRESGDRAEQVDAGDALVSVVAGQGAVRIQMISKGAGQHVRPLLTSAVNPAQALVLARALAVAASEAVQPQLPLFGDGAARTQRFSAADLAEMRRQRAAGVLLREIAERFGCAISTVARQTTGISAAPAESGQPLFRQMPLPLRPTLVKRSD